jgi:hypothetical protein
LIASSAIALVGLSGTGGKVTPRGSNRTPVRGSKPAYQRAVGLDRRAVDEADEVWQAQSVAPLLEGQRVRHRRRGALRLASSPVEPLELGDRLDVFEQRIVAPFLDDLNLDGRAVPCLHLVGTSGDDQPAAWVEAAIRGDESRLDLADDALGVADADVDGRTVALPCFFFTGLSPASRFVFRFVM